MQVERVVTIQAPPEIVWSTFMDVERWPAWTATIRSAERAEPGPLRLGARTRLRVRGSGLGIWTVTSFEEGRFFAWESRGWGTHIVAEHAIEPSGNGARVTLRVELSGLLSRILGPLLARGVRQNLEIEASGLRRECEAKARAAT
jgi:uncharacterized protein YndB with AHSA1/START domain